MYLRIAQGRPRAVRWVRALRRHGVHQREIEEEELDTGPGRNAEELLRSKKRLAAGVYDTCH